MAFAFHLDNGIHIPSFIGSKTDMELMNVIPLLKHIANAEDITLELKKRIKLTELYKSYLNSK